MKIAETVFLVVGLALLGGSGAWYYYGVERPLSWPRADAVVVSSRVINPREPNQHTPELVLRLETGGRSRQVTITGAWSSGSYDMVKRHVDRYPAGSSVEVAVNPHNDADVRYELGPTATNLIGPGVLGFMGVLFAGAGIVMLTRSSRRPASTPAERGRTVAAVAAVFGVIGIVIVAIGVWMGSRDLEMLRSWAAVDAESIAVRTVTSRSSIGNRPSTLMYDVQVTFRYEVNGTPFQSRTTSGLASSSTRRRDELLKQFAPGTRHRIRHRPGDPNVIRYGLDYSFRTFMLSGGMALMGLIFIGFAMVFWRSTRRRDPAPVIRILLVATCLVTGSARVEMQEPPPAAPASVKPDQFSPLGFLDLRAYEQAYPGSPGSALVQQASTSKYWAFRGIAYRGLSPGAGGAWTSMGPETSLENVGTQSQKNVSGRVSALAISPRCQVRGPCRLWVGTAGGGVWRSDDAMNTLDPRWRWVSRGLGTNNIGSLTVDPNDRREITLFVGTGETNQPNNSGAGTGLYRSIDGGERWTRIPTMITDPAVSPAPIDFTSTRGISTVVVQPGNSQTIYVATASAMLGMTGVRGGQTQTTGYLQPRVGLYKTENGGASWKLIWVPPLDPVIPANPDIGLGVGDTMFGVRDVKLDPRNPRTVYATAWNNAIHRSAPSLERGDASFKPVFAIVGLQRFRDLAMFDIVPNGRHTRLYVYNGTENLSTQSLYRLDDADGPASALVTTTPTGALVNGSRWIKLTSDVTSSPGSTSRRICSTQCFYDLVVASPDREPNTVIVGGVATPDFGEPTIRSTNAGVSFSGFGNDAQNPRNASHVDVRAIVFHPRDSRIAFVGSDGGVVRNDGVFVHLGSSCPTLFPNAPQCQTALSAVPRRLYFLNKGLQTLQFYNISVDPQAPLQRMMGGLQDNSTIWIDGTGDPRVWKSVFPFGDGTSASGFHLARPGVLFASFQSNNFFTNFRNGDSARWVRTDGPIRFSNERATITQSTGRQFISFDAAAPDTQFTGFQHVWRTQNNGGPQAFLEATCTFPGGSSGSTCGDWVPIGVTYPFAAGTTPGSASRKPGDLTSDFYGSDRTGGLVVSAERTAADAGTLWVATNFGRLFISKNANVAGNLVTFVRLDGGVMPNRFVTRIAADPTNANVAYLSYSGFNVLTPNSPGHVFRAVYDPATQSATFTSLDFDLGDLPINTIAYDWVRGDIYAATDFGPLRLPGGASRWEAAGVGFPEALMVDLEIIPAQRLIIAATHGLGIFYLTLPG